MKLLLTLLCCVIIATTTAQSSAPLQPVTSAVFHWSELPVIKAASGDREGRKLVEGTTLDMDYFEIHATTQQKGAIPAPPHTLKDREELIIVKEGTMKCTIGDQEKVVSAGSVILIPPNTNQFWQNIGNGPLSYYVFAFKPKKPIDLERSAKAGGPMILNVDSLPFTKSEKGGGRKYFDRPTATTERFEMHVTQLSQKGPSHTPHQHPETEIILIINGQTSMVIDGKNYTGGPGDLYIMESGKLHGISNASDKPCSYFAFKWK